MRRLKNLAFRTCICLVRGMAMEAHIIVMATSYEDGLESTLSTPLLLIRNWRISCWCPKLKMRGYRLVVDESVVCMRSTQSDHVYLKAHIASLLYECLECNSPHKLSTEALILSD